MSTKTNSPIPVTAAARFAEMPTPSTRLARVHIDAMIADEAPLRTLVVGPSGSGKSRILRHLRRVLVERGLTVVTNASASDIRSLPAAHVLLVDDAHLLDDDRLDAAAERADDDGASLIVATRPWPLSTRLAAISSRLERTQPAIVLGHLARSDLASDAELPDECADDILIRTGGTAWLVAESLEIHAATACTQPPDHSFLQEALQDVIAHRLHASTPRVRELLEELSLAHASGTAVSADDDTFEEAYSDGLVQRNGQIVPIVRAAVRSTMPVERLVELYARDDGDDSIAALLSGVRDTRAVEALIHHADAAAAHEPRRAAQLLETAADAGAGATMIAIRRARVDWTLGDVEAASAQLDAVSIEVGDPDAAIAADTAAAIWSARGLAELADQVYRTHPPTTPDSAARASLAALAAADRDRALAQTGGTRAGEMPSTLGVSLDLLAQGVRASLDGAAQTALSDFVRASEMYTSSDETGPVPELPAVVAALAAIHLGELDVARSVIDAAVRDGHGGTWARDRLVLWSAWIALQQERAPEVEAAIQSMIPRARGLSPRDKLLFDALSLAIARRYHDAPALEAAWRGTRESLLRARFDLFSILPLCEFVATAARIGESDRLGPHLTDALARMAALGAPPLWSAHLHWAGIQQGILLGRPDDLAPHARALVAAAPHNRLAAMMAQAGRVWTTVLSGDVDADLVEKAATGLASVGLAWDGARLAGHGASRSKDRKAVSQLLACARRLHPRDDMRPANVESRREAPVVRPRSHAELSPREREVAVLVVEGKTYAEIGSAIFISPRTAEHHIARIRRRLEATTRSDLIAKLRVVLDDEPEPAVDERASA
ncbi:isoniazid response ATPase/transcriptional regulator IniR [Microbacterium aoyamense]|uniref:Isoniazid response ATPase/transcriptional regulator IniR n=1 Tax=Microbacterium aoyamense TaxID=344166 RepID=A0ABN2PQB9_9MICO|nr:LuxR C-terminal-related transcriptional regulator [Microbacterium aoyamense]